MAIRREHGGRCHRPYEISVLPPAIRLSPTRPVGRHDRNARNIRDQVTPKRDRDLDISRAKCLSAVSSVLCLHVVSRGDKFWCSGGRRTPSKPAAGAVPTIDPKQGCVQPNHPSILGSGG